eukprot:COSAG06_NODE_28514_length_573_cov_0.542194_1_plen_39_part_10
MPHCGILIHTVVARARLSLNTPSTSEHVRLKAALMALSA